MAMRSYCRPDEPTSACGAVLIFGNEPAVLAEFDVAADLVTAIVAGGAVGIEADQPRQPSGAAVDLVDDLFVVDAFEELPRERHVRGFAALAQPDRENCRRSAGRPFSISLSWILRCFLTLRVFGTARGGRFSSWRKRTSWRRAAYT